VEGRRDGRGKKGRREKRRREGIYNLRKTTPRHQMADYGPDEVGIIHTYW